MLKLLHCITISTCLLVKREVLAMEEDVLNASIVKELAIREEIATLYMVFPISQPIFP